MKACRAMHRDWRAARVTAAGHGRTLHAAVHADPRLKR
jgi:hypothetical protein